MMLRRIMLRRNFEEDDDKDDVAPRIEPRTHTHTLCEPAQSKCTSTFHKSHFIRKFTGKMPRPKTTSQTLCEPAQSKPKFAGKMSRRESAQNADSHCVRACAPAQSTCTSTFNKSNFLRKFTGKCRAPAWAQNADTYFVRACAVETHVKISQEQLYTEIYGKNAEAQSTGFYSYRKNPSVWTHCLGEYIYIDIYFVDI